MVFKPYRKPNDNPMYINNPSNHPPIVLRQLAKSASNIILEISSYEQRCKESIPIPEEALKNSGFHTNLEYVRKEVDKHSKEEEKRRKQEIIWFNLPYSNNVKSNVRKQFLKLVRQHFPKVINSIRYLIKIPLKSVTIVWEIWATSWQAKMKRFYQRMKSNMNATVEIKMSV